MIVRSFVKDYQVEFTEGFSFMNIIEGLDNKLLVVDKNVWELYREKVFGAFNDDELMIVEAVEANKSHDSVLKICERMLQIRAKRNAVIVSFGGGIVQDITGFSASILYRGIRWIFIPTTLLSQADSCIGSKTSLNYKSYKNILGTFYPPDRIFIDMGFLDTLKDRDFRSGLGEILKFNIINGRENFLRLLEKVDSLLLKDNETLKVFIESSLDLKKKLIEEDEFDNGRRQFLNYGHTFGHAVESATNFEIPHGLAVLIGIIVANTISKNRGELSEQNQRDIEQVCLKVLNMKLDDKCFDYELLKQALKNDKKNLNGKLTCLLLNNDFRLFKATDVQEEEIMTALEEVKQVLNNGR